MKVTSVTEAFWAKCLNYEQKNYASVIIFPRTTASHSDVTVDFALGQSPLFVDAAYVVSMERTNADLRQPWLMIRSGLCLADNHEPRKELWWDINKAHVLLICWMCLEEISLFFCVGKIIPWHYSLQFLFSIYLKKQKKKNNYITCKKKSTFPLTCYIKTSSKNKQLAILAHCPVWIPSLPVFDKRHEEELAFARFSGVVTVCDGVDGV